MSITTEHPGRSIAGAPASGSTADDTLNERSRDASVISGGPLRAKALEAEAEDESFMRRGGHDTARRG